MLSDGFVWKRSTYSCCGGEFLEEPRGLLRYSNNCVWVQIEHFLASISHYAAKTQKISPGYFLCPRRAVSRYLSGKTVFILQQDTDAVDVCVFLCMKL